MFQGSFKDIFKEVLGVSNIFKKISKKKVPRVSQECFNEVFFRDLVVARISSQLPEQKEGLLCPNYYFRKSMAQENFT